MKAPCSMSSQVLALIERTRSGPVRKKVSAAHLGNALSRRSRFVAMLFCHLGRVHSLHENEAKARRVTLVLAACPTVLACTIPNFVSHLPHNRIRSGHGCRDFGGFGDQ
ncbi:hypothetical protein OKW43_008325 [Paraburkholderia sp. WC7.3g]